jgi:hypothetical protein
MHRKRLKRARAEEAEAPRPHPPPPGAARQGAPLAPAPQRERGQAPPRPQQPRPQQPPPRQQQQQQQQQQHKQQHKQQQPQPQPRAKQQERRRSEQLPAAAPVSPALAGQGSVGRPRFSFAVDESDHCETPAAAYADLVDLLDAACSLAGKSRTELRIYDPFYCDGAVVRHLSALGFPRVYNRCECFYACQASGSVPEFDVLVTNPPYSGDHVERLVEFVAASGRPWFALLPNWVYTKSYYPRVTRGLGVSYLVRHGPGGRYAYEPPAWVSSETGSTALAKGRASTAPFPSFWYFWFPAGERERALAAMSRAASRRGGAREGALVVRARGPDMMRHPLLVCLTEELLPYEVRGELDQARKRPNAKARARMKRRLSLA